MSEVLLPYNFDLRPYQREIWKDKRDKVLAIHRRAGKTTLAINKLIVEAIKNPNKVYYYVCPTYKQAKNVVWTAPEMLSKHLPPQAVDKKNDSELVIYLKNGAQIHVKGADNYDSLRGVNPFGVIFDEYELMKPQVYDEIFSPILEANHGWKWFIGTPMGKNDFFRKLQVAKAMPEKWQWVVLQGSKSGVLSNEVLNNLRASMTERAFSQEIECEFLDGAGSIFRRIKENATAVVREPEHGHTYQLGVDLARLQDFTVLKVVDEQTHKEVYTDRFNQVDWNLQEARIEAIARRYFDATIRIDATGLGDPIVQALQRRGLNVKPFTFSANSKKVLIDNLALKLEKDDLQILQDETTINELESFTYEISGQGHVRYTAPEGQHDDCVMALALACYELPDKQLKVYDDLITDDYTEVRYNEFGEPI